MERAIADINALGPDIVVCSGDLTTFGFKEEYVQAKRYLDRLDCESLVVIPGNHDSRNVGYIHFEELFGERNSVLRQRRRHRRRRRLDRARSRPRPDRPRPLPRGSRQEFAAAAAAARLRPPPPPAAGAGHRARAQHRLRRRRRDRVPAARRCEPRPLRAQARSLCVAAREPVRRQHRHGLDAAPARQHAALLQRRRGQRHARGRLAPLPVPRAGADHPVRSRDARVREVHLADRAAR